MYCVIYYCLLSDKICFVFARMQERRHLPGEHCRLVVVIRMEIRKPADN